MPVAGSHSLLMWCPQHWQSSDFGAIGHERTASFAQFSPAIVVRPTTSQAIATLFFANLMDPLHARLSANCCITLTYIESTFISRPQGYAKNRWAGSVVTTTDSAALQP